MEVCGSLITVHGTSVVHSHLEHRRKGTMAFTVMVLLSLTSDNNSTFPFCFLFIVIEM